MIDTIKDYIFSKRFSILAYVCVIIHFHCGVLLTAITTAVRLGETEKFSCRVDTDIATRKIDVEKTCFSLYDDTYNSPVRFHVFAVLNFGSVVLVSVIYSLAVGNSIDETERYVAGRDQFQTAGKKRGDEPGGTTFYVFYFYFIHLVARLMLGILFTILQHSVSYPSGFDSQFSCVYPDIKQAEHNITAVQNASINTESSHVTCTNSAAQDKQFWVAFVSVCNVIFAIITLAELIYLIRNQFLCFNTQSNVAWSCDSQFITEFFLRKQYMFIPFEDDTFTGVDNCTLSSIDIYKQKVLKDPLIDINYGPNVSLNDMFIDVVIQTEQAPHKFLKGMSRHEIYDVCMEVPKHSIRLKERKDLFYPNKDTEGIFPHTILTLGRLGIGKTVLTRKILHDWANDVDYFYQDKITFLFKLRCFNFPEFQSLTLKKFLQFGTELNEDQFESIFEQIIHNSHKLILIFDGLDELCSNSKEFEDYIYRSKTYSNNPDIPMSALFLFIKIIFGDLIENATVLVTSRPTASDVYSKLNNKFDRRVEIIGFTADKIEKYVEQFCVNHQQENLKPKIWNHINSSPEIKNLCYIPVNSFIVCVTLLKSLTDPANDNPLPTTLTELYQAALVYFHKNHDKSKDCYENVIKELQFLAFKGMENDKLIFDDELVNEQMKESGLLHCLPAAIFQIQTQVCFIHLTVQEFLAAKYIVETKEPKDIKKFISSHVEHGKWHLVLQFLAGLLGRKMKMFDQYRSCVLVFTEHLSFKIKDEDTVLGFDDEHVNHILVMKCLRETEDEDIAKDAALTPALKTVTWIQAEGGHLLGPSEYASMVFVCKHLNFLTSLTFERLSGLDCLLEVLKLLQERCIHKLSLELSSSWCESPVHFQHVISALADSECRINHKHSKLTLLKLRDFNIADAGVSTVTEFLCKNAHQICLQELDLRDNKITSRGISTFCDVLGHEVFNMLMYLNLDWNPVGDDGIRILCEALRREKHRLQRLSIGKCSLTTESIFALVEVLSDKHCEITELVLNDNKIGDKGAQTLFAALELEQCCLTQLNLKSCSLTEECMAALSEVLCGLIMLNLSNNKVGDEGMRMLCSAFTKEQCKLTMLFVRGCLLTDECLPSFCEVLREERCRLTWLDVMFNDFTDKYLSLLSDTLQLEHCCLEFLNITSNHLTKKGEKLLKDVENSKYCKARRLKILSKN